MKQPPLMQFSRTRDVQVLAEADIDRTSFKQENQSRSHQACSAGCMVAPGLVRQSLSAANWSIHTPDPLWAPLKGNVGVTIFFVISGFIITTLRLREDDSRSRVRIGAFYTRRAFRILPVYYLVLVAYIMLIGPPGGAGWGRRPVEGLALLRDVPERFRTHSDSGFSVH
jgi:hypothetical protein